MFFDYLSKLDYSFNSFFILGNGSNIIASDKIYNGIVVSFKKVTDEIEICKNDNKYIVNCPAGVMAPVLANFLNKHMLTGGEAMSTIPGTIGGLVTMNASCYDFVISDYVSEVLILYNNDLKWYNKNELNFEYRDSIIRKNKMIVLYVKFIFSKGIKEDIIEKTCKIKNSRLMNQPVKCHTAGSIFKNKYSDNVRAWKLIDECKLKGFKYKNVMISEKHSNFLINNGDSGDDIYILIMIVKEIDLESEIQLINF